jgi:hypothetical protein
MLDFKTGRTLGLLVRTAPFVLLRVAVYAGIALAYALAVGAGAAIGLLFGKIGGNGDTGAGLGSLAGFVIACGILYWAREYLLYLVKAAHVAVLIRLLDGKPMPGGQNQIAFGREAVKQHFASSSLLFGLNQSVRGALRAFNGVTLSIASWLPIPGLEALVKLIDKIIATSLSHLDQVILAQILRKESADPWATACDSVVLYAQNYEGVFKNAAFLTFIVWGLTLLIFLLVAAPVVALVGLFHVQAGLWTFALTALTAWSLKAAIIDPFVTAALMQMYDKLTAGQVPDVAWAARLESISDKFRGLVREARNATAHSPKTSPAVQTTTR